MFELERLSDTPKDYRRGTKEFDNSQYKLVTAMKTVPIDNSV